MKESMRILLQCPLFSGIAEDELPQMLACLSAVERSYARKETLYAAGDKSFSMGVLLAGRIDILQEDFWGNAGLLARLEPGDVFAESFVLAQVDALPVSVVAAEASTVLLLDYPRILHTCTNACAFHDRLIANLLSLVARKNIALTRKAEHVSKRSTREKLLAYLSSQAQIASGPRFSIPYNRQALADYLAVDRSALSRTMSEMQQEGLLTYHKNEFVLGRTPAE